MARTIHFRSTGQVRLPPNQERIARIEREKEETRRREERERAKRKEEEDSEEEKSA